MLPATGCQAKYFLTAHTMRQPPVNVDVGIRIVETSGRNLEAKRYSVPLGHPMPGHWRAILSMEHKPFLISGIHTGPRFMPKEAIGQPGKDLCDPKKCSPKGS